MVESKNSKDRNRQQMSQEDTREFDQLVDGHWKLLKAIGKL